MITITIDSNVSEIPASVASLLGVSNAQWCQRTNKCSVRPANANDIFINSPISMADSITGMPVEEIQHFIYVDYRYVNDALQRILKNIKNLKNKVIFSNADAYAIGRYQINVGNATNSMVAEFIAHVVKMYRTRGVLVHPDELRTLLGDKSVNLSKNTSSDTPVQFDLYSIFECQQRQSTELKDCRVCSL